mmetsp:Transcript_12957/g.55302  ORF Transcript_12957/g.55302 Transcript_12957/m.55302 type:complete len:240 (-) Transcript_12957:1019-1738(-)
MPVLVRGDDGEAGDVGDGLDEPGAGEARHALVHFRVHARGLDGDGLDRLRRVAHGLLRKEFHEVRHRERRRRHGDRVRRGPELPAPPHLQPRRKRHAPLFKRRRVQSQERKFPALFLLAHDVEPLRGARRGDVQRVRTHRLGRVAREVREVVPAEPEHDHHRSFQAFGRVERCETNLPASQRVAQFLFVRQRHVHGNAAPHYERVFQLRQRGFRVEFRAFQRRRQHEYVIRGVPAPARR